MNLAQRHQLQQVITPTPRLIMTAQVLHESGPALLERIRDELEENPLLVSGDPEEREPDAVVPGVDASKLSSQDLDRARRRNELDAFLRDQERCHESPASRGGFNELPDRALSMMAPTQLRDELARQLRLSRATEAERRVGVLIIYNLDDDGYLREPELADLAQEAGVPPATAERALRRIQRFEPVGVAARSLAECLRIQAERAGIDDALFVAILDRHLDALRNRRFAYIAAQLGTTEDEVEAAAEDIARLDPRPGSRIGGSEPCSVLPDVTVRREGDQLVVDDRDSGLPRLHISSSYRHLLAQGGAAADFVRKRLESASLLIDAVTRRGTTIVRVMEAIVRRQRAFFDSGLAADLRPLQQREIADELGLDKGTISRAVSDKFADTPFGVLPLKSFFVNAVGGGAAGEESSAAQVREALRAIVRAEDPACPQSDSQLVVALARRGFRLSRRAVAKYRERMDIPAAPLRRRARTASR